MGVLRPKRLLYYPGHSYKHLFLSLTVNEQLLAAKAHRTCRLDVTLMMAPPPKARSNKYLAALQPPGNIFSSLLPHDLEVLHLRDCAWAWIAVVCSRWMESPRRCISS
eukprot:SAG25_NODE_679_length_5963_cov_10.036835_8_plen_108_part_00